MKTLSENFKRGLSNNRFCPHCKKDNIELYQTEFKNLRHYESNTIGCKDCIESFEKEE